METTKETKEETTNDTKTKQGPKEMSFASWHRVKLEALKDPKSLFTAIELCQKTSVPFAYHYQRQKLSGLKEAELFKLLERKQKWDELEKNKEHSIREIKAQNKLTEELETKIKHTYNQSALEDLYLPYKLKKKTLARQAVDAGLEEFAIWLWDLAQGKIEAGENTLETKAQEFVKADTKYNSVENVIKAGQDILTEKIAETADLRADVRSSVFRKSKICTQKGPKAKEKSKYARLFNYKEPIGSMKKEKSSHRYLNMRKGWLDNELLLTIERPDEGILLEKFENYACPKKDAISSEIVKKAASLALKGNVFTVVENEAQQMLRERSEDTVIQQIANSLKMRLMQAPFGNKPILGIDSGMGKKIAHAAIIDAESRVLADQSFSLKSDEDWEKFSSELKQTLEKINVDAVAVSHGSFCKKIRTKVKETLSAIQKESIPCVTIYDQSVNTYASSAVSKDEFPKKDNGIRRAIFIARYLQNPLMELIKIDPKFLSLGPFQYDLNTKTLNRYIHQEIQSAICKVGIDINKATKTALDFLPSVDKNLAENIIKFRNENGAFKSLTALKQVNGLTEDKFESLSGFFYISDSPVALERSRIHPNDYKTVEKILTDLEINLENLKLEDLDKITENEALTAEYGKATMLSFQEQLLNLVQDPRGNYALFQFNSNLTTVEALEADTLCPGVITNITSFGAFVDIGLEQDGLIHISEFMEGYVSNPFESFSIGQEIQVWVKLYDKEKQQISLSLRSAKEREEIEKAKQTARASKRKFDAKTRSRNRTADRASAKPNARGKSFRNRDGNAPDKNKDRSKKRKEEPQKKKTPKRDPKTGAIVKGDDNIFSSQRGRSKFSAKAKPTTFNPFANLGAMIDKDTLKKEDK